MKIYGALVWSSKEEVEAKDYWVEAFVMKLETSNDIPWVVGLKLVLFYQAGVNLTKCSAKYWGNSRTWAKGEANDREPHKNLLNCRWRDLKSCQTLKVVSSAYRITFSTRHLRGYHLRRKINFRPIIVNDIKLSTL